MLQSMITILVRILVSPPHQVIGNSIQIGLTKKKKSILTHVTGKSKVVQAQMHSGLQRL